MLDSCKRDRPKTMPLQAELLLVRLTTFAHVHGPLHAGDFSWQGVGKDQGPRGIPRRPPPSALAASDQGARDASTAHLVAPPLISKGMALLLAPVLDGFSSLLHLGS
jgi:hypothetical protein